MTRSGHRPMRRTCYFVYIRVVGVIEAGRSIASSQCDASRSAGNTCVIDCPVSS